MANDLLDKIPPGRNPSGTWKWRSATRNGLSLQKDEASAHLAEAHLEKAMNEGKGIELANGPQTPLRKEGKV
jgi:hypothetical protein